MTIPNPTIDELIEKLLRTQRISDCTMRVNPDGPAAASALSTLLEQKRKLEEALKPFAEAADRLEKGAVDAYPIEVALFISKQPLVCDLRNARALLSGGGEG